MSSATHAIAIGNFLKNPSTGLQIVTMPGLGHYPSDEKPADFVAIVERFLADASA